MDNRNEKAGKCVAIRVTMMPKDTNEMGTIFGGVILSHIDVAGSIEARRLHPTDKFVTVAMNKVEFKEPVYVGDLVSFYTETLRVGTTSVTVKVTVEAERRKTPGYKVVVTEAEIVYVCVDQNNRPVPVNRS